MPAGGGGGLVRQANESQGKPSRKETLSKVKDNRKWAGPELGLRCRWEEPHVGFELRFSK